jgi:EmrB/QacA subfamily drug resistance transporter
VTTNTVRSDDGETPYAGHPRRWLILATILIVETMDLLDSTIVNVATKPITADLRSSSTGLQWIVGGYSLAFAVGLVLGGRFGDIYGRRRMFLIGIVGFTLASIACSLATGTGTLITARLAQGLLGAMMIPQGFGIMLEVFNDEDRVKAFGLFGPVIGMSAVLGPILGGFLVDADLFGSGWRSIFFINVPGGITAFVLGYRILPVSRDPRRPTLDLPGAFMIATASFLLIFPLVQGRESNWAWWTWACLGASLVLFVIFAKMQLATQRHGRDPLVTPSLFGKRHYILGLLVLLTFFGGMAGAMLSLSVYLQFGVGFSPSFTGISMIGFALGLAIGAGLSGVVLTPRFGRHVIHAGCAVMTIGLFVTYALIGHVGLRVHSYQILPAELIMGLGVGFIVAPLFGFVLASVEDHETGSASGVLNAVQQLAAALGVAVIGTVFFQVVVTHGFAQAFQRSLLYDVGAVVLCAVLALGLPMQPRELEELEELDH